MGGSLVVKGNFLNSNGTVLVNPSATPVTSTYSQSGGVTDISGVLTATSFKQSGGTTTIESGGLLSTNIFKVTVGTVAVNGILDPTAVEIDSGAGLQGTGTITGNVAMGGTLTPGAPGTPGTFTIFGNYVQIGNGTLEELMGRLDSDSVLSITLLGGFNPLGDTFSIMEEPSGRSETGGTNYCAIGRWVRACGRRSGAENLVLVNLVRKRHESDHGENPQREFAERARLLYSNSQFAIAHWEDLIAAAPSISRHPDSDVLVRWARNKSELLGKPAFDF